MPVQEHGPERDPEMFNDLSAFDAGPRTSSSPMNEVISYASRNWEFFLEDTAAGISVTIASR